MRYYATLGPACCEASALAALLRRGVSGFRLNVSPWPPAATGSTPSTMRSAPPVWPPS